MDITPAGKSDEDGGPTSAYQTETLTFLVGDITEVALAEAPTHYSVTAVLNYCKNRILRPYLRLLSVMGLRPIVVDADDSFTCSDCVGYVYTAQVVVFVCVGYVLQYMACFRRDRGFGYRVAVDTRQSVASYEQICHGSLFFSYVVPNLLHLVGYLFTIATFRSSNDDQLPNLMERVFLSLSNLPDGFVSQRKLVKVLWLFVSLSLIWMALSFVSVNFLMAESAIDFKWMDSRSKLILTMKILLVVCTLWHDMIQATVISNYCLQAQLLVSYVRFLRSRLLQHCIEPVEWMRDIQEFKQLLKFFNRRLAPAVCIFTVVNVSCSVSGVLWLLNYDHIDNETMPMLSISILNVCLWGVIALAPFVQAARLTMACTSIRSVGHEVRVRPFVHQTTPAYKLDSILLYASSLRLNARLFGVPITGTTICVAVTLASVATLILGQLHYLNSNE